MSAVCALVGLVRAGVQLTEEAGRLRVRAPTPLPAALLALAREEKAALLWIASGAWRADLAAWPGEFRDEWEERAAIMEYEGNLSRELAEAAAYLDVASQEPAETAKAS